MRSTRRIVIAGLPVAGLTVFAALTLAGSPATASVEDHPARPAVMVTPCADGRDKCDYGTAGPAATTPGGGEHTRGHGGYTATSTPTTKPTTTVPTTKPTPGPSETTPSGGVDTVSPTPKTSVTIHGGATPTSSHPGGVSAGHALPVTGAPMGAIVSLGGLMVAAGVASLWYTRRRRNA
jgi:LPXTG-motif cell wall-anchored protein